MSRRETASPYPTSVDEIVDGLDVASSNFVAIFDFDGVMCHPEEDLVYRLSEQPGESEWLANVTDHYGIDAHIFDLNYARHLVFQAIQAERRLLPRPGPMLDLAKDMTAKSTPFFILTARSGPPAVERVMNFLAHHQLRPQEMFFVGRVPKGRQLALVKDTVARSRIWYFEDSPRHIRNSRVQAIDGMLTIRIDSSDDVQDAAELWRDAMAWFERTHAGKQAA